MHLQLGSHGRESQQQQEAHDLGKVFKDKTRSDWNFAPLLPYRALNSGVTSKQKTASELAGGFKPHGEIAEHLVDQITPGIEDWLEREFASSDSDTDAGDTDGSLASERLRATSKRNRAHSFLFDNPHSVKEEMAERKTLRRLKRQHMQAEEMDWNEGLQHFISRRDAWTGARSKTEVKLIKTAQAVTIAEQSDSLSPSPRSSTSAATDTTEVSRPSTAMTSPDPASIPTLHPLPPEMLIPRMSKVLGAHPIRRKIGPGMYSEIYSKIILQSRTPSVPINLLDLIRALVSGWKADGEWPPRPSVAEPSVGRRRTGLREGVKAAARVLKISALDVVDTKDDKKKAG